MTNVVVCFALIWLSIPLLVRAGAGAANPVGCAEDMSNLIEKITTAAADIKFSTVDCTPPTLDELDCSSDIMDAIQQMANVAATISSSTFTCGGIDNSCAVEVSQTIADFSDFAIYLVAAAADCVNAPFNCVVDVVEAINSAMSIAMDIYAATQDCNPEPLEEYRQPDPNDEASYNAAVESLGLGPNDLDIPIERRLAGEGHAQALLQTAPSRPEDRRRHAESARQKIAGWREAFAPRGTGTR
ncbi:unnamed protein product [Prorocentrum cordatum]|uniref:Uncharacterized protein n=1 Tax=Prorocentrum cordatum TaxID=2364126 RepID=A0ABN9SBI2_9DINO|nr:unnamed protein product [Polarella glacialis]|mmetsp:Transcript_20347/g.53401  ORF Transcript_20347/g.53401 Transcript_20347/m.53401 type:complete len:243 (+) Transcript_20347:82-810(+)